MDPSSLFNNYVQEGGGNKLFSFFIVLLIVVGAAATITYWIQRAGATIPISSDMLLVISWAGFVLGAIMGLYGYAFDIGCPTVRII